MTTLQTSTADLLHQIYAAIAAKEGTCSQERIARELGVCYQSVNRWMSGKVTPLGVYRREIEALAARVREYMP